MCQSSQKKGETWGTGMHIHEKVCHTPVVNMFLCGIGDCTIRNAIDKLPSMNRLEELNFQNNDISKQLETELRSIWVSAIGRK